MEILFPLLFPLLPLGALWMAVRHGPVSSPWWRGETVLGFGLFVGGIAFLLGFVGPMVLRPDANQGPLLGIFITGPFGVIVGIAWGAVRAGRRRSPMPGSR